MGHPRRSLQRAATIKHRINRSPTMQTNSRLGRRKRATDAREPDKLEMVSREERARRLVGAAVRLWDLTRHLPDEPGPPGGL